MKDKYRIKEQFKDPITIILLIVMVSVVVYPLIINA